MLRSGVTLLATTIGRLAFAAAILSASASGEAQVGQGPGPGLPSPDAIRQVEPTRPQLEPQRSSPAPASTVRVDIAGALPAAECDLDASTVPVTLSAIRFETPEGQPIAPALQALLAPAAVVSAGEQPISVVCRVRDRVNELLSRAGYVALAQIPQQTISDGQLRIQIVTARIVEIRVLGDLGPFRRAIEQRIDALRALDPLNRHDAERILLLAGDIPGVDVTLALSPAQNGPGEVIGTLTVATQRLQVLANVQNFGSPQLGPWVGSIRTEAYGLTGLADRTFFAYSNAVDWNEIRVFQAGHDFALNGSGLRAQIAGSVAFSQPGIKDLDLRSRSAIVSAELNQVLVRSVPAQLRVAGGFEMLDQRTRIFTSGGVFPFTRDRLRVFYGRLDGSFNLQAPSGVAASLSGYAELRQGTDLFGATRLGTSRGGFSPSRIEGDPQATVVRGEILADIRTPFLLSLGAGLFGQWASDPLLNLEEFSLGNYTYGRGYDPGSNGGDRAIAFRLEPRVRVPAALPVTVELTGFYDWVRLYNTDSFTTERRRLLRSVGGGVRLTKPGAFAIDAYWAQPLDRALLIDKRRPNGRVLVSLTMQLHPWGGR